MLYIVATPIGNLQEITFRAIETLKLVDYILCEDTRTSKVLLDAYEITKPLKSYHKFNETKASLEIIEDLKQGKNIALISDAGMPGISDPGSILVREVQKEELEYTVISGASALINAFVLSGFETPFTFIGFLPDNNKKRMQLLQSFETTPTTLIFYCSPHSIVEDLADMNEILGDRKICVVREISKKFESVSFSSLSTGYTDIVKGEFVVLVDRNRNDNQQFDLDKDLQTLLNMGLSKNDASKVIAKARNIKKSDIYNEIVKK